MAQKIFILRRCKEYFCHVELPDSTSQEELEELTSNYNKDPEKIPWRLLSDFVDVIDEDEYEEYTEEFGEDWHM